MRQGGNRKTILMLFLLPLMLLCCVNGKEQQVYTRLQQWDALLQEHPGAVLDSLRKLDPVRLSQTNRAYHGLLKTIAEDKTYTEFTSDSLISGVERYYSRQRPGGNDHIRSLIYQGIVRIRMGDTDTTAYIPLEKAKKLFSESKRTDPSTGYLLNYYLGDLHYNNGNYYLADIYYKESLRYAGLENVERHIFDAYTALFWNEMTQGNCGTGKLYLDTLLNFNHISAEIRYNILNMQSVYYDTQGDFNQSLQCEKEMLNLLPSVKYNVDEFRTLFSISDRYKSLNQPDSAIYYGLQAIRHINDTTYKFNYLLYQNVADIALQQKNYKMAEEYRSKMFEVYEHYVNDQSDKIILELEKRYDLTEAENKAFRSRMKTRILFILSVTLVLLIALISSVYYKHQKIAQLSSDKLQAEKLVAESEAKLLQRQAEEQKNIIHIYGSFLTQYSELQQRLKTFEMKIRGSHSDKHKLADEYKELLKQGQDQFHGLSSQLFPVQMFETLIDSSAQLGFLTEKDKLLLILLTLKLDNTQIAALLNTTPVNLKSKKSYLKKKIMENASTIDNFEQLTALF